MAKFALLLVALLLVHAACAHAQDDGFDSLFGPSAGALSLPTIIPFGSLFSAGSAGSSDPFTPVFAAPRPRMTVRIIPMGGGGESLGEMLRGMQAGTAGARSGCVPCATSFPPRSFASSLPSSAGDGSLDSLLDNLFSQQSRGSALRAAPAAPRSPALPFPSLTSLPNSIFADFPSAGAGGSVSRTIVDDGTTTKTTTVTTDAAGVETHTTETKHSDGQALGPVMMRSFSSSGGSDAGMKMSDLLDEFFGIPAQRAQVQQARAAAQEESVDEVEAPVQDNEDMLLEDHTLDADSNEEDAPEPEQQHEEDEQELALDASSDEEFNEPEQEEDEQEDEQKGDMTAADKATSDVQVESEDLKKLDRRTQDSVLKAVESKLDEATKGDDKTKDEEEELELEHEVDEDEEQSAELREKMADQRRRLDALKEKDAMEAASAAIEAKRLRDAAKQADKVSGNLAEATNKLSQLEQRLHDSVIA